MIYNVVKSLPCSNNSILVWSHPSPFFKIDEAINKFKKIEKKGYDSLFASARFVVSIRQFIESYQLSMGLL